MKKIFQGLKILYVKKKKKISRRIENKVVMKFLLEDRVKVES